MLIILPLVLASHSCDFYAARIEHYRGAGDMGVWEFINVFFEEKLFIIKELMECMKKQFKSKKRNKTEKTVYFLGAGFTKEAGVPPQSMLLKKTLDILDHSEKNEDKNLKRFIEEIFSFNKASLPANKAYEFYPTMEDIFSVMDIALQNEEYVKNFRYLDLSSLRKCFMFNIIEAINIGYNSEEYKYIENFAKYLTKERLCVPLDKDPFSIISTNWDIVLINAFIKEFANYHKKFQSIKNTKELIEFVKKNQNLKVPMIDYCIYTHSIKGENSIHIPSTKIKAYGVYNVKYVALHGHANFLFCPKCLRIFSHESFKPNVSDPGKLILRTKRCIYCKDDILEPVLIMPSYIRNFKNHHYHAIWQNAAIELQEATKIVFIGYSLPQADFYIRHLLLTNLNKDAEIEIVTKCSKERKYEKCKNYVQLFGDRILEDNIHHEGACKYIRGLTKDSDIICGQPNQ